VLFKKKKLCNFEKTLQNLTQRCRRSRQKLCGKSLDGMQTFVLDRRMPDSAYQSCISFIAIIFPNTCPDHSNLKPHLSTDRSNWTPSKDQQLPCRFRPILHTRREERGGQHRTQMLFSCRHLF
jgi:hypothetical protein